MSVKHKPQGHSEPAQPLLPSINLARLFLEGVICECLCVECPPWNHSVLSCHRTTRAFSGVPPSSNTGVHGRHGSAAASDVGPIFDQFGNYVG